MYKLIVGELGGSRRLRSGGGTLAAESCRISALSSADYCLRDRVDVEWGRICWRGNRQEILRLFEAERLNGDAVRKLDGRKEYAVVFLGRGCA